MLVFFSAKCFVGLLLYLVFTYYYTDKLTVDIYKYYTDGNRLFQLLFKNPSDFIRLLTGQVSAIEVSELEYWEIPNQFRLYNDYRLIILFNFLVRFFSFGSVFTATLFMCFISFFGLFMIYKVLSGYFQHAEILFSFSIFLLPSTLVWTSLALKEGLSIFFMGYLLLNYNPSTLSKLTVGRLFKIILCLTLLLLLNQYLFVALVLSVIAFRISTILTERMFIAYLFTLFTAGVLIYLTGLIWGFNPIEILAHRQAEFLNLEANSMLPIVKLDGSLFGLVKAIPTALFNTILQPLPWGKMNVLYLPNLAENVLLFAICIAALIQRKEIQQKNLFLLLISFAFIQFLIIGLSVPILGAIVRYKIFAESAIFFALILQIDENKVLPRKLVQFWTKL